MHHVMGGLRLAGMALRYSQFVPKLYNYCLSLGFQRRYMMPSRAFCSDESQGYPVILLAQHFGTFPFDHGRVGGKVATDRHGPHAHHGEDLVIIQASHVGYDAGTERFGVYQRQRTKHGEFGANCGKICGVLDWYEREFALAGHTVLVGSIGGRAAVVIDNALLDGKRPEGIFLVLDRLIDPAHPAPLHVYSTSKAFTPAATLRAALPDAVWAAAPAPIGAGLSADMFVFRREAVVGPEGHDMLEEAIAPAMPLIVTSATPALDAARYHTQIEFDRTYRSIQREPAFIGKNLLFVAGLNIDVSPRDGLLFPLTKFIPWAAYARLRSGESFLLEQDALFAALNAQSAENVDQISFDAAIQAMADAETVALPAV